MTNKSSYNINKILILLTGYFCSTIDKTIQNLEKTPQQLIENPDAIKNETEIQHSLTQTLFGWKFFESIKKGENSKVSFFCFLILFSLFVFFGGFFYQKMKDIMFDFYNYNIKKNRKFLKERKEDNWTLKNKDVVVLFFSSFILVFCQSILFFFGKLYFYCVVIFFSLFLLQIFQSYFFHVEKLNREKEKIQIHIDLEKSTKEKTAEKKLSQDQREKTFDEKKEYAEKTLYHNQYEEKKKTLINGVNKDYMQALYDHIILIFLVFLSSYFFSFYKLPFISNLKCNIFVFIFSYFFNFFYICCFGYLIKKYGLL